MESRVNHTAFSLVCTLTRDAVVGDEDLVDGPLAAEATDELLRGGERVPATAAHAAMAAALSADRLHVGQGHGGAEAGAAAAAVVSLCAGALVLVCHLPSVVPSSMHSSASMNQRLVTQTLQGR